MSSKTNSSSSLTACKVIKQEPLKSSDARWTNLVKITYTDPNHTTRTWESAERLTRPKNSDIDGVGVTAIIQQQQQPHILLQKQFRPPVGRICIELPAGLSDAGESPEECALRELKEETGYIGKVDNGGGNGFAAVSPVMFNAPLMGLHFLSIDPGFCNTNLRMVNVLIDPLQIENREPKSQLEESEFIECFAVPLSSLHSECKKLESEGYAIDARVGTMAEGIELAKRWKLT